MGNLAQRIQQSSEDCSKRGLSKMLVSFYLTLSLHSQTLFLMQSQFQSVSCVYAWQDGGPEAGFQNKNFGLGYLPATNPQLLRSKSVWVSLWNSYDYLQLYWRQDVLDETQNWAWSMTAMKFLEKTWSLGTKKMLSESAFDVPLACLFQRQREMHA